MSKKKNTLKDLDEFLKQQAATLVPPTPLSEKVENAKPAPVEEKPVVEEKSVVAEAASTPVPSPTVKQPAKNLSLEKILEDLETLAQKEGTTFRKKLYDLVLQAADAEEGTSLPEDKMLINTILYLTNGPRWKDAIRDYWRAKG